MSRPEIILHNYQGSPYVEKAIAALRIKGLPWCSVNTSPTLPRPLLEPLTNGYRRMPVMQIGNHVYCDTAIILKELERRYPTTYNNTSTIGVSEMVSSWVDKQLFANTRDQMPWGATAEEQKANPFAAKLNEPAFVADRSQLTGSKNGLNVAAIRRAQPLVIDQLISNLDSLEKALEEPQQAFKVRRQQDHKQGALLDGGWILGTKAPSMADCSVYAMVWWLLAAKSATEFVSPQSYPSLFAWWAQMNAFMKHHRHTTQDGVKISGEEALQIARDAAASSKGEYVLTGEGMHAAEKRKVGDLVTVSPNDYGKIPVRGRIVEINKERICIRPEYDDKEDKKERLDVYVHFPRNGYIIVPVRAVKASL
ncbi:hypothetical protein FBU30_005717 [Linnemannia zychae]|nr:hypothetical protein FBU30_005717 [Linnemannia zychae]